MMRFLVTRATLGSEGHKGVQPCEEAVKGRELSWNPTGTPYTSIRETYQEWFVEFNDLDELNSFVGKYGPVVIEQNELPRILDSITDKPQIFDGLHLLIYDAYIE